MWNAVELTIDKVGTEIEHESKMKTKTKNCKRIRGKDTHTHTIKMMCNDVEDTTTAKRFLFLNFEALKYN